MRLIIAAMLIGVLSGCSDGDDRSLAALKDLRDRCPVEGTITEAFTIGRFNSSFMVSCSYIKPSPK